MTTLSVPFAQRLKWLAGVPAFAHLPAEALDELGAALGEEHHPAGGVVVTEGEEGDRLYLIVQGRAEASTRGPSGPVVLATLETGELFGEIAFLTPSRRRQATVTALTALHTLTLDATAFTKLLRDHPEMENALAAAAEVMATVKFLKQASPFSRLEASALRRLSERLEHLSVPAGVAIVKQGEQGESCYLLRAGRVEVRAKAEGISERRLATLGPGTLFGETALLMEAPRNATVISLEPCDLLVLHRSDLMEAMGAAAGLGAELLELARLRDRPRRADGILAQQRLTADGETIMILKDPERYRYYRLSEAGWFIWQRLDGEHTLRDLTLEYFNTFRSFSPHKIAEVIGGLAQAGFVHTKALRPHVADMLARPSLRQRALLRLRPFLEWRVALHGVDAPITRLYRAGVCLLYTRWGRLLLGSLSVAGLLAFVLVGARAGSSLFTPEGDRALFFFLIPAYLLALVVHEAGHAFTTKAFGREVPAVGVGWYWFAPIAFVDTSDMWLAERWPRMAVSLAGPYANMVLAGGAALAGWLTTSAAATAALWQLAFVSYLLALLNLNPLLEYDGYHALADLLERPNLRSHAFAWLRHELPKALLEPAILKGHLAELVFGASVLLYVMLLFGLAFLIILWIF